jgi:hypothetical protein
MANKVNILALDPGKSQSGYCFVSDGKLVSLGELKATVNDMKAFAFMSRVRLFYREFRKVVKRFEARHGRLTHITVERFLSRGAGGMGAVGEVINITIGILALYSQKNGIHIELVSPSTWKGRYKRAFGEETQIARYGFPFVTKTRKTWPISDHIADAVGIGQWTAENIIGKKSDLMPGFKKTFKVIWNKRAEEQGFNDKYNFGGSKKKKVVASAKPGKSAGKRKVVTKKRSCAR